MILKLRQIAVITLSVGFAIYLYFLIDRLNNYLGLNGPLLPLFWSTLSLAFIIGLYVYKIRQHIQLNAPLNIAQLTASTNVKFPLDGPVKNIGIVLVHGIGDQARHEHLASVAHYFANAAKQMYEGTNISASFEPGIIIRESAVDGPAANLYFTITNYQTKTQDAFNLCFHEVWWRDLHYKPTIWADAKFWAWACSVAGTTGKFYGSRNTHYRPAANWQVKHRELGWYRLRLLLSTTSLFILLLPFHIFFSFLSIIPIFARLHVFRTVYTYLSSLQMYERNTPTRERVDDLANPRRISVQRRMLQTVLDVASLGYDRWYICGHSLGSVISFKALMTSDEELRRLLPPGQLLKRRAQFTHMQDYAGEPEEVSQDAPTRPGWIKAAPFISMASVFKGCRGFVSYGSPLEGFFRVWPALVYIKRASNLSPEFEWINLYDPLDPISSSIDSMQRLQGKAGVTPVPMDYPIGTTPLMFSSHTSYLRNSARRVNKNTHAILDWIVRGEKFKETLAHHKLVPLSSRRMLLRRVSMISQWLFLIICGLVVWPTILTGVGDMFFRLQEATVKKWWPRADEMLDRVRGSFITDVPAQSGPIAECAAIALDILLLMLIFSVARWIVEKWRTRKLGADEKPEFDL